MQRSKSMAYPMKRVNNRKLILEPFLEDHSGESAPEQSRHSGFACGPTTPKMILASSPLADMQLLKQHIESEQRNSNPLFPENLRG